MKKSRVAEDAYQKFLNNFEYGIYHYQYIVDNESRDWSAVVIRHKDTKVPVQFTGYEDLLHKSCLRHFRIRSSNKSEAECIVQFLQYILFDNYEKYKIRDIHDVTMEMAEQWIYDYAGTMGANGRYPNEKTVARHMETVSRFLWMMCDQDKKKMKYIKKNDVLIRHPIEKRINGGWQQTPNYSIEYMLPVPCKDKRTGLISLNRDMPDEIVPLFIDMALVYDPEMAFPIILATQMGLRSGEICYMRQPGSCYNDSFIKTIEDGVVTTIQVDLTKERVMRSDGKSVGKIKRERTQEAFSNFVEVIEFYYQMHMKLIKDKPCEAYKPLFLNKTIDVSTGCYMAMTVGNYRYRIMQLYEKVLEQCKYSDSINLQRFYARMTSGHYTWGPHSFRHWFTVRLLTFLDDTKITMLRDLRGDENLDSAATYLKNKGKLFDQYKEVNDEIGNMIRAVGEEERLGRMETH